MRAFQPSDITAVRRLLLTYRGHGFLNHSLTKYRLDLLIDSRLWEPERDAQVWEDTHGQIVGFAMLNRRRKESTTLGLERIVHPTDSGLAADQLAWAAQHAGALAAEKNEATLIATTALERDSEEDVRHLLQAAFTPYPDGQNVYMGGLLDHLPTQIDSALTIEPLAEAEIGAYEQIYDFTPISRAHRLDLLHDPNYSHLVAKTADGAIAAYLECSLNPDEWVFTRRHLAWIDYIGTVPGHQQRGIATALLAFGLGQLKAQGATEVRLITSSDNHAALKLYQRVGMAQVATETLYTRQCNPRGSS